MKRTLLLIVALCVVAWLFVPPAMHVDAEDQSGYTLFGAKPRKIKHFNVVAADSGDNTLVAAVADKKVLVLSLAILSTSTTSVSAYLHNGDNALLGDGSTKIPLDVDGIDGPAGLVLGNNTFGWFKTDTTNEALSLNLSGATSVICVGAYVEVD